MKIVMELVENVQETLDAQNLMILRNFQCLLKLLVSL